MKTLKKNCIWTSNDYWACEEVELYFSDEKIKEISDAQDLLIKNPNFEKIVLRFEDYDFHQNEDEFLQIKCDVSQLYVFQNSVLFYCQDKWESSNQMEFDFVFNSEIGLETKEIS